MSSLSIVGGVCPAYCLITLSRSLHQLSSPGVSVDLLFNAHPYNHVVYATYPVVMFQSNYEIIFRITSQQRLCGAARLA